MSSLGMRCRTLLPAPPILAMTYKINQTIPNIWVQKSFGNGLIKKMFKWYEVGILGCGPEHVPWIDLEHLIEWPKNLKDIAREINNELYIIGPRPGGGACLLPKDLNGYEFLTHYQYFHEKYIDKCIVDCFKSQQEFDQWVAEHLSNPVWGSVLLAKQQPNRMQYWLGKHSPGARWDYDLPLTRLWIDDLETYLFKHIGRVVIYKNKVGQSVPIHRDFPITEHRAHFVNFQITASNRPAFVYDEVTKEKIYTTSRAYMFNESDCHGVDDDGEDHFTIRVDGTFKDHICKELNLPNGVVFSNHTQKLKNLKIIEPSLSIQNI